MKKISEPIVFFGSGPVAAQALQLLQPDFDIEAVVTKPKPVHHRGEFPVLRLTRKLGLKTLTPANRQELSELFKTKPVKSHLGLVIDYGIIIPKGVIDYFPLGIVNSHFSLLPQWRGADPITFAILSGQSETGVSLMLIVERLDEGPLLAQKPCAITPTSTTPELTDSLIKLSHELLAEVLPSYVSGVLKPYSQDLSKSVTYSRKLTKQDGVIDWTKPAEQIEREIRAFIEWPKSRTSLAGKEVIITKTHVVSEAGQPGKAIRQANQLIVYCGQQAMVIDRLKPAGGKDMTGQAFMAGHQQLLN